MTPKEKKKSLSECFFDMLHNSPIVEIQHQEYSLETKQLTIYCTDGSVYRLQMIQIN